MSWNNDYLVNAYFYTVWVETMIIQSTLTFTGYELKQWLFSQRLLLQGRSWNNEYSVNAYFYRVWDETMII